MALRTARKGRNAGNQFWGCSRYPACRGIAESDRSNEIFELIQIVPSPTISALNSCDLVNYRISEPRIMGYLRNNSMFAFGKADRARTSATMREIMDAMWLFNDVFAQALAKFGEIKAQQKG